MRIAAKARYSAEQTAILLGRNVVLRDPACHDRLHSRATAAPDRCAPGRLQ